MVVHIVFLFNVLKKIKISGEKNELIQKSFYTLIEIIEKTDLDKLKNELSIIKEKYKEKYKSKNSLFEDYYSDIEKINKMIKDLKGKLKASYKGCDHYGLLNGENNG